MTPEILPLLAASFACISVLALFARRNQRTGWVKPARIPMEDLVAMERNWRQYPVPVEIDPVRAAPARPSSAEVQNFTLQLAHFHEALASATIKHAADRERCLT